MHYGCRKALKYRFCLAGLVDQESIRGLAATDYQKDVMSPLIPITFTGKRLLEGPAGAPLLKDAGGANLLIEACYEEDTTLVLLYAENLPSQFFDLSSGVAGAVLQKLVIYHIRLAVIRKAALQMSSRFTEMLSDQGPWGNFKLFDNHADALNWLCWNKSCETDR